MNNNLIILGAGGHGKVVFETASALEIYNKIDFIDDNSDIALGPCEGVEKYISEYKNAFVAFGDNKLRIKWIDILIKLGFDIPVLTHPSSYISPSSKVEKGTIVLPMAVINTNVVVNSGCIIGIGALVDHDSTLEEGCHINSGAIIKSYSRVESLYKVDAGIIYT